MPFDIEFDDPDLDQLEIDPSFTGGWSDDICKAYRKVMNYIRNAEDERDFSSLRGLRFEKLKPPRSHQHSMRLNKQWRLIVELRGEKANKKIAIVKIEDYH